MLRAPVLTALLGGLGLLAAGCGGGSRSPSVASVGSNTANASDGGGSAALTPQQETSIDVVYGACLNTYGVAVEAMRTGGLAWVVRRGAHAPGPRSSQAAAAERDCKSVLPRSGLPARPTVAQNARALAQLLRYAECIRAHGVSNFPDPTSLGLRISPSSGINMNSPQLLAAQRRCQSQTPTLGAVP